MGIRIIFTLFLSGLSGAALAQKGEKNIVAGPLLSFPLGTESRTGQSNLKPGLGAEAIGQFNFSNKNALLLKTTLASWGYKNRAISSGTNRLSFLTLQGGCKFQLVNSGFFIDGLVGTDTELQDGFTTVSFTLGVGKRFMVINDRFIDAGIDLVGGDAASRVNFKVIISLFRRPAAN